MSGPGYFGTGPVLHRRADQLEGLGVLGVVKDVDLVTIERARA